MNKDLTQGGNFAILPGFIRYEKTLTDSEKMLYAEVTALSNRHGYCYASNQYFSELYGVTTVTISRRIKALEKKGYLKIDYVRHGASIKSRKIFPLTTDITAINTNDNGDYQEEQPPLTEEITAVNTNVKENNLSTNNLNTNNLNTNKEGVLFEKWWKIYPKKTGNKKRAKSKFDKAISEVGEEQFFRATEIYLKTQDQLQFICGPEVFLNQERYTKDAMETYQEILTEKARGQVSGIKNNQPNAYNENADLIEERRKQREADMLSDDLPFG